MTDEWKSEDDEIEEAKEGFRALPEDEQRDLIPRMLDAMRPNLKGLPPLDDLLPANLKTIPHPTTTAEAFDGGVFWEAMILGPRSHDSHLAYFRAAVIMCADSFDASMFSRLDEMEMIEEAQRFGRRYADGAVHARADGA